MNFSKSLMAFARKILRPTANAITGNSFKRLENRLDLIERELKLSSQQIHRIRDNLEQDRLRDL